MKNLALAAGVATLALGIACSKKPEAAPVTSTTAKNAPSWIDNPNIPNALADVGYAQPNAMGDKGVARSTAIADARGKLAAQLKVRVQTMFSRLDQQYTTASTNQAKKPIRSEVMQRMIENVQRNMVDLVLQGSTVQDIYNDPTDGALWVRVVVSKETLETAMKQEANKEIRREIQQGEKALEAALDKLDAAIAASR